MPSPTSFCCLKASRLHVPLVLNPFKRFFLNFFSCTIQPSIKGELWFHVLWVFQSLYVVFCPLIKEVKNKSIFSKKMTPVPMYMIYALLSWGLCSNSRDTQKHPLIKCLGQTLNVVKWNQTPYCSLVIGVGLRQSVTNDMTTRSYFMGSLFPFHVIHKVVWQSTLFTNIYPFKWKPYVY